MKLFLHEIEVFDIKCSEGPPCAAFEDKAETVRAFGNAPFLLSSRCTDRRVFDPPAIGGVTPAKSGNFATWSRRYANASQMVEVIHLSLERSDTMVNRLANATSPYLLQHRRNPVDWRPWGEEAFAEAKRRDAPIFLSVGYSACHWCHVMAHESFEDEFTAAYLNEHFVNVKVDREERPDVDAIYMEVTVALTGHG